MEATEPRNADGARTHSLQEVRTQAALSTSSLQAGSGPRVRHRSRVALFFGQTACTKRNTSSTSRTCLHENFGWKLKLVPEIYSTLEKI